MTLISMPSTRHSLRCSAPMLGIFSVGGVEPAGVRGAAPAAGPSSRGTLSRGSTTICVRSMWSAATAIDASVPQPDTIPSRSDTTSSVSFASNSPISRSISPSRTSRRRFSITSGRPLRTAPWAGGCARSSVESDAESPHDFLTFELLGSSGTLVSWVGAISDPSETTSGGPARAL